MTGKIIRTINHGLRVVRKLTEKKKKNVKRSKSSLLIYDEKN